MVRRESVGAHYGLRDWLMQRVTAVVIAVYLLVLLGILMFNPGMDLAAWKSIASGQVFRLATFVALVSVMLHAWVGMRDIFMDYIRSTVVRLSLEVAVIGALLAYLGWTIQILWGMK
jgi:succinate dehydrogenase / fumarate reductase membrane anchor subunit